MGVRNLGEKEVLYELQHAGASLLARKWPHQRIPSPLMCDGILEVLSLRLDGSIQLLDCEFSGKWLVDCTRREYRRILLPSHSRMSDSISANVSLVPLMKT